MGGGQGGGGGGSGRDMMWGRWWEWGSRDSASEGILRCLTLGAPGLAALPDIRGLAGRALTSNFCVASALAPPSDCLLVLLGLPPPPLPPPPPLRPLEVAPCCPLPPPLPPPPRPPPPTVAA